MKPRLRRLLNRLRSPHLLLGLGVAVAMPLGLVSLHLGWYSSPRSWESTTGWDRLPEEDRPSLAELWNDDEPGREPPRLTWLGHSGFLVEWKGRRLLLDPNVSDWCTVTRRVMSPAPRPAELGPIDAAILSHAHFDHLDMPTLRGLESLAHLVVPDGAERYFEDAAFASTHVLNLDPEGCVSPEDLAPLEICAVETQHNGNRLHPFESRIEALGYVIRSGDDALFFAGDTGFEMDFAGIASRYRPRAAILPIGAYLPRFPMKHYHLSPEEAVAAAALLGVETAVPCHFGTFTVSLDRPDWALPRFALAAKRAGLSWMMPKVATREVRP